MVDKHNYHMKEIVLGRHWVSAHMIDLMDIYNTSIVIRNRNFQAQANVSDSILARIIDESRLTRGWQLLTILRKSDKNKLFKSSKRMGQNGKRLINHLWSYKMLKRGFSK